MPDSTSQRPAARMRRVILALVIVSGLALATAAAYSTLRPQSAPATPSGALASLADPIEQARTSAMAETLAARLANDDSDAEGWLLLARSYASLGRLQEAVLAYAKSSALAPGNADLLIEYANTLSAAHDRDFSGEPQALIRRALTIDPDNLNALALAGAAAMHAGNRQEAARNWTRLSELIPAQSPMQRRLQGLIGQISAAPQPAAVMPTGHPANGQPAGMPAGHPSIDQPGPLQSAEPAAAIRGTVTMVDRLAARVSPVDTLFVFARASDGPAMPLAIQRTNAAGWPASFALDDSRAMAPGLLMSAYERFDVIARISRAGNATPQPGDLEGRIESIALGSHDVRVVIDRVIER